MTYHVQIIETATSEVVEEMNTGSERAAERMQRGVEINMNHAEYHTKIVEKPNEN